MKFTWTQHALDRASETPFKIDGLKELLSSATLSQLKRRIEEWKFKKYGMQQCKVKYYRSTLEVLYTVSEDNTVITCMVTDKNKIYGRDAFSEAG